MDQPENKALDDIEAAPVAVQERGKVKWFPWLVPAIVVANTVAFIYTMYVNNCPEYSGSCVAGFLGRFSFQPLKENGMFGPSTETLQKVGAQDVDKIVNGHEGWRLIASMWLHGGLVHLLGNMTVLVIIGIRLEQEFGFARIGLLYLISGYGGNLLSALLLRDTISVGASGAIMGILGGMLSELIINWSIYTHKAVALLILVILSIGNLASPLFTPHVDNFAHIGGFLSGFLLGFVFLIRPQIGWVKQIYPQTGPLPNSGKPKFKVYQYALWVLSFVLIVVGLAVGTRLVLHGYDADKNCSWCRYLSCFPPKSSRCNSTKCLSTITEDQLTLTCSTNMTRTYTLTLPNPNTSTFQLQGLCNKLCRN